MLEKGSVELFRFAGIQVSLHWSWFLVAAYSVMNRRYEYTDIFYPIAEYLALFCIVLLHEFGHSLACRQVGGRSDRIVLWPLGGIAFVDPPRRPGAVLWSIAAGPLVNVLLVPVTVGLWWWADQSASGAIPPDLVKLLFWVMAINGVLLVFNLLPVYPLDGGQILQSLLWFFMGFARSLYVASILGFVGVAALVGAAMYYGTASIWTFVLAAFVGSRCWVGFVHARERLALERRPRNTAYRCPSCGASPLLGLGIKCGACGTLFDPYATTGVCPACGAVHPDIRCVECGAMEPIGRWSR